VLQTDTIWIPSQGPIIIDKPIDVRPLASLTIQAGVSIIFTSQDAGLRIYGKLIHLVKHVYWFVNYDRTLAWYPYSIGLKHTRYIEFNTPIKTLSFVYISTHDAFLE
jgi:hypothetical protein